MRSFLIAAAALSALVSTAAAQNVAQVLAPQLPPEAATIPPAVQQTIDRLQTSARDSTNAWDIVEGLTTEIGPRLAGSQAEAKARDWAVAMLRRQGFQNVRIEPFTVPYWERVSERAWIVTPNGAQKLVVVTLGGSGSTPAGGVDAEIVRFDSIAALREATPESVRGKIVFIDEPMVRTQDGSGYGAAVGKRGLCAPIAQGKGAAACLIRSVGTDHHRMAHQGGSARGREGATLPAAALSPPDADQLTRLLRRGPVRVKLEIEVATKENAPSGNVIGEIVGRERPDEIVIIGGHLDSWDQGTGAIDNGAGVAITTAAAKLIRDLPRRPRRTIRVVLFGSEETGAAGGANYAKVHEAEIPKHVTGAESDFGADEIYRLTTKFGDGAMPYARALHRALAPLGVNLGPNTANGGADLGPLARAGVPLVDLNQNGWDYFDLHHTPDDTLDKIDRAKLNQNVAAYATFIYLAAEMDWDFRKPAATPAPAAR